MAEVIKQIGTRVVLPMHYMGQVAARPFHGLIAPLEPELVWPEKRTIETPKEDLPSS